MTEIRIVKPPIPLIWLDTWTFSALGRLRAGILPPQDASLFRALFVDVVPGRYKVFGPDDERVTGKRVELVDVSAGAVARFAITPFANGNEGRRPSKETTTGFDPMEEDLLPNGERRSARTVRAGVGAREACRA